MLLVLGLVPLPFMGGMMGGGMLGGLPWLMVGLPLLLLVDGANLLGLALGANSGVRAPAGYHLQDGSAAP